MKSNGSIITAWLAAAALAPLAAPAKPTPSVAAGLAYHPAGAEVILWNEKNVYVRTPGSAVAFEITSSGSPIAGAQGVVYQPQGTYAAVWTKNGVCVRAAGTTRCEPVFQPPRGALVQSVFADGSARMVVASSMATYQLYLGRSPEEVILSGRSLGAVSLMSPSPDGTAAILANGNGTYLLRANSNIATPLREGGNALPPVRSAVWNQNGQALLSTQWTMFLLPYLEQDSVYKVWDGGRGEARGAVWRPDGSGAVIWSSTAVKLYSCPSCQLQSITAAGAEIGDVRGVAFSPNGSQALLFGGTGLYGLAAGQREAIRVQSALGPVQEPQGAVWSPASQEALVWTKDGRLYKYLTSFLVVDLDNRINLNYRGAAYHPNGRMAAAWSADELLLMYDTIAGRPVRALDTAGIVFDPLGLEVMVMQPELVSMMLVGSSTLIPVSTGAGPLVPFNAAAAANVQAIVRQSGPAGTVYSGAGVSGIPMAPVTYAGSPNGSVWSPSDQAPTTRSAVVGAGIYLDNMSAFTLTNSTISGSGMSVLTMPKEETGGATTTKPGGSTTTGDGKHALELSTPKVSLHQVTSTGKVGDVARGATLTGSSINVKPNPDLGSQYLRVEIEATDASATHAEHGAEVELSSNFENRIVADGKGMDPGELPQLIKDAGTALDSGLFLVQKLGPTGAKGVLWISAKSLEGKVTVLQVTAKCTDGHATKRVEYSISIVKK